MAEKEIKVLIVFSDGSANILSCHRETLRRTITEAVDVVRILEPKLPADIAKILEPKPPEILVLEELGGTLGLTYHLCLGCGKRLGNRRTKADAAYCGRCRRKNNKQSPRKG